MTLVNLLKEEQAQLDSARLAAERVLNLSLNRYQEGAVSCLQVVSAQVIALQAERALLTLRVRALKANVNLVRALGRDWRPDWTITADTSWASDVCR